MAERIVDQRFPWIVLREMPGMPPTIRDTRTGVSAYVRSAAEVLSFVAQHSAAQGHGGLGDAVRGLTKKLGFGECTPCAKRQAALNAIAPRVFRR